MKSVTELFAYIDTHYHQALDRPQAMRNYARSPMEMETLFNEFELIRMFLLLDGDEAHRRKLGWGYFLDTKYDCGSLDYTTARFQRGEVTDMQTLFEEFRELWLEYLESPFRPPVGPS